MTAPAPRVAVVGAGIAGLVTAKVLVEDGFDVTVVERDDALGGVWAAARTYPGLRANNTRETYAFSDHPFPASADEFPTAPQMRAYLKSYVERFALQGRIRFGSEVVSIRPALPGAPDTEWRVVVRSTRDAGCERALTFAFVVICNGVFHTPSMPEIEGADHFAGEHRHSSQLAEGSAAGKRVVVVGASKSALDCAAWAARESESCTLVFRQAYWMWPRHWFGVVSVVRVMFSRAAVAMLESYRPGRVEAFLHRYLGGPVRLVWRGVTRLVDWHHRIPRALRPTTPLPAHIESTGVGGEVYPLMRAGKIRARRTTIRRFAGGRTVELDDGQTLEADLVVFATGYRQEVPCLDPAVRRRVEDQHGFRLYRLILPPGLRTLAFNGYNSSTACQLTAEVAAHWISDCFLGRLALPSVPAMEREVAAFRQWAAVAMPARRRGFFIGPFVSIYLDDLMCDMGLRPQRARNVVAEHLLPLWPTRYAGLAGERRQRAGSRKDARTFTLAGDALRRPASHHGKARPRPAGAAHGRHA